MSKQWHVQQSTAEQLYEQTPDETVQLIWTDPPFGTDQLQVGSEHSYRDGTVADTLALIDHQQVAIQAGAKALAEHQIGEDWGDEWVPFIVCDCGQRFGKRVDDGEELARTHEAQAALTAATPHLRAGMAEELLDDTPGSPLTRGYQRLMDPKTGEHPVRTWEAAVRVMLDTLLEGGA